MADISVIVNLHAESAMLRRTVIAAKAAMARASEVGYSSELILVLDNPTGDTFSNAWKIGDAQLVYPVAGDLGLARNEGVKKASGRWIAFCDGDDLFGREWLARAAAMAETRDGVFHPQWNYCFGEESFFQEGFSTIDPRYDANTILQHNPWSALCFASRALLIDYPYEPCKPGVGIEDWRFHLDTLDDGIKHWVVPQTLHLIRFKPKHLSLCNQKLAQNTTVSTVTYFDRGPYPAGIDVGRQFIPSDVVRQAVEAQAVEPMAFVHRESTIRNLGKCDFADRYWAAHAEWPELQPAYIASWLGRGGAEKWLLNCLAVKPGVVVLTDDGPRDWVSRLPAGCTLVDLRKHFGDNNDENLEMLRRLLIQKRPDFIHATSSGFGWAVIAANPETLLNSGVRKLVVSSFNDVAVDNQRVAPAYFHTPALAQHVTFLTDNNKWAKRLQSLYGKLDMRVLHQPVVASEGKPRPATGRLLYAGRIADDKGIQTLLLVARRCGQTQIHIRGEGWFSYGTSLPDNVDYCGAYDSPDELPWQEYGALILASKSEGMPNVVLEAAANGLPAFTFLSAGDASLPCPMLGARDEAHMVQLINSTSAELLAKLGEEAREYVREIHNWDQWKTTYGEVFK